MFNSWRKQNMLQMSGILKDREKGGSEEVKLPAHPFSMKKLYIDL